MLQELKIFGITIIEPPILRKVKKEGNIYTCLLRGKEVYFKDHDGYYNSMILEDGKLTYPMRGDTPRVFLAEGFLRGNEKETRLLETKKGCFIVER